MGDDEGVDRAFGVLELKANLVFDGGEDGDYVGATGFGGDVVGPFEGDVGVAGEAGLVDDPAAGEAGEARFHTTSTRDASGSSTFSLTLVTIRLKRSWPAR